MCLFNLANVKNSWTNKESKQSEKQPLALEDGADESKSGDVGSTWRSNLLVSRAQAAAVSLPTPCQLHRHSWNQSIPPRPVTLEMLALERAESRPQPHPGLPSCGRRLQRLSLRLNTHIGVCTRARTRFLTNGSKGKIFCMFISSVAYKLPFSNWLPHCLCFKVLACTLFKCFCY